jgi:hypothetical protein
MLLRVGNVTLPTPVFVAGGALCLVAGYLIGAVAGPDGPERTTATVVSYESRTATLCLEGDSVKDEPGAEDGELCGTWSRAAGSRLPRKGDRFRFVAVPTTGSKSGEPQAETVIYGSVVAK